ncbi:glycosyltransferase 87 family protein [Solwaraspora sp. WMMB335]|uniref:glycosyltransferase 87 family protein n=1 Tax=Solwaraspora sp. WMMB335 TaxID=3404118 RepID=UPI003B941140
MSVAAASSTVRHRVKRIHDAAGGLIGDLGLYLFSAGFAGLTAATSTLVAHRAWGTVATVGYAVASLAVLAQLALRRPLTRRHVVVAKRSGPLVAALTGLATRAWLTGLTWTATVAVPLVVQAAERAAGRTDRAQEEVLVVEDGGARLLATGSPYLSEQQIAALPAGEQLLGYLPYQPGMVVFGIPRALAGTVWWTDARIWFAAVTVAATAVALVIVHRLIRPAGGTTSEAAANTADDSTGDAALVRAAQLSSVLPVCALTLSTGGDDLPVLALALLALALCAARRYAGAGAAVGAAAALKLFAWPILAVLLIHAATRRSLLQFATGGLGLPILALLPAAALDATALVHNVLGFPLGAGLVSSPAASPLPGQLIATWLPGGRAVAGALLLLAGLAIAGWLIRHPPRTAASAAAVCGVGLLIAIMLMPATRFGYLLYPIALLSWAPALIRAEQTSGRPA